MSGPKVEVLLAIREEGDDRVVKRKLTWDRWQVEAMLYCSHDPGNREALHRRHAVVSMRAAEIAGALEHMVCELLKQER